ncbi:S41 family peptidase [Cryobacterium soli]|uniref:S41 family peptidase n=1 Tax=Cryobacterium soli TaxID=2220095 RepID=UPI000E75B5C2|nr:S41 family peptidase [Cryobacterium soli]
MSRAPRSRQRIVLLVFSSLFLFLTGCVWVLNPIAERLNIFIVPPSPQRYAALAVEQMRPGLRADDATYAAVVREVDRRVAAASILSDTYPALQDAAVRLGGEHSAFLDPAAADTYFGSGGSGDETGALPTVVTEDGVSTLSLPTHVGGGGAANQRYTDAAIDGLAAAEPVTTAGWVLDLRGNHGGNVWPMLAAVAPLLSDGQVMSFDYADRSDAVTVEGATVSLRGAEQATSTARTTKTSLPIAVLIDGMTGSSAEAVAISFVSQPNAELFGQPSYGFSTVNEPRRLYDGAAINLTTAVDADRSGTRYGTPIVPDHVIDDPGAFDPAVRQWLARRAQTDADAAR